jgi:hypothetical protein
VPLGYKEFQDTGKYISQFEIGEDDGRSEGNQGLHDPTPVMMSNWEKNDKPILLRADFRAVDKSRPTLSIFDKQYPIESSLYVPPVTMIQGGTRTEVKFRVADGDVIPIFGELYAIKVMRSRKTIQLTRITDSIPKEFQPRQDVPSRTIAVSSLDSRLFFEPIIEHKDSEFFDAVHLQRIDEKTRRASMRLIPDLTQWFSRGGKPLIKRKPLGGEISTGGGVAGAGLGFRCPSRAEGWGGGSLFCLVHGPSLCRCAGHFISNPAPATRPHAFCCAQGCVTHPVLASFFVLTFITVPPAFGAFPCAAWGIWQGPVHRGGFGGR